MTKAKKNDIIKMHMKARMTGKVPRLFKDINKLQHLKHKEHVDMRYLGHYNRKLDELGNEPTKERLDAGDRYRHHDEMYDKSAYQAERQADLVKDQVSTAEDDLDPLSLRYYREDGIISGHFFNRAVFEDWIQRDIWLDEDNVQSIEIPGVPIVFY